ncbi:GGDEF domain-containing protein [Cellulomonas hominis]|uniref:GGDEF domain-containing protein n=1 Tax=Cellulomonas hominis TaxID=156981 RepID=UPI001B924EDF|nr:GGDEF domain-containing protein [Cellulomonas hominis]VTR78540.1 Phytochrome-like protein cph2 [Cellulomonas hominis]
MTPTPPDDPRARDRAHEAPVVVRLMEHIPARFRVGGNAAAVGRLLLLFCGAVVLVGALLLGVDQHGLRVLAGTSAAMLVAVGLSLLVPWARGSAATVAFPVVVLVALGGLGLTTSGVAGSFAGLIPLCFVYLGLFHPGRVAVAVLPLALAAYVSMVSVLDSSALVRLSVYAVTWWAVAQSLALATEYQRDLARRLRSDARTDALTSLANRRDLDERLTAALPGDCLVIADLDHFKCVNDTQGHVAGDAVLERFGHHLDQHLRRRDYAARYGGEEFVLILPRTEPVQAMNMLRALRTEWAEEGTGVTFSAGIALITEETPPGSALAAADIALYRAKQAGRDRFRIATEALGARRRPTEAPAEGAPGGAVEQHPVR